MKKYIDGYVFPISQKEIEKYKQTAEKVAEIWKEYGATEYIEFIGDDLFLKGTRSFIETIGANEGEIVIFGWIAFPSKAIRDLANKKISIDSRIPKLIKPLTLSKKVIFDASRMVYGGFKPLISLSKK